MIHLNASRPACIEALGETLSFGPRVADPAGVAWDKRGLGDMLKHRAG